MEERLTFCYEILWFGNIFEIDQITICYITVDNGGENNILTNRNNLFLTEIFIIVGSLRYGLYNYYVIWYL